MAASNRAIILLPLLLVSLPPITSVFQYKSQLTGMETVAQDALVSLVSESMEGHDVLLVTDEESQHLTDMRRVVAAAGSSHTPLIHFTTSSLLYSASSIPVRHTKGAHLTALVLFNKDPTGFLLLLEQNLNWSPAYLILFCINPQLNTTSVLNQPVVQRSLHILFLHLAIRFDKPVIHAYTSLPQDTSTQNYPFAKTHLGLWNHNLYHNRQSLFLPRYDNFRNQTLEVSILCFEEPFLYFVANGDCIGANLDALQIIADKLNFKILKTSPDDINWGSNINGTWNGLLGELMYEGRHISINVLQPSPDRASEFDYTYPYWEDGFGVMIRVPDAVPQWRNVLYPFTNLIWGLVIVVTIVVPGFLALMLWIFEDFKDPISIGFKVAAGIVQQSVGVRQVKAWWARVYLLTWWLAAQTILSTVYQGNLVAVLAVPVYPKLINTVKGLADSDLIPSMLEYGDFAPQAMRESDNPTLNTIGNNLEMDYVFVEDDLYANLLSKVLDGTHALIVTIDYLVYTQHWKNATHTTYIMEELIFGSYMSWFLPRNTPFTGIISDHHMRLLETGILHTLYNKHIGGLYGKQEQARGDGVLNMDHLQGAFILLGIGLMLSALVLLVERYV